MFRSRTSRFVTLLAVFLALSAAPNTNAHDYDEVKEGRWRISGTPRCEGYNLDLYRKHLEQKPENQKDEFRFSQFGDRVVATNLYRGQPKLTVLGKVSEEYMHFQKAESSTRGVIIQVWSVEILADENQLKSITWTTADYADRVWVECDGYVYGGTCWGDEYATGVPNFPEGYKRYSVKCTSTLTWVGR